MSGTNRITWEKYTIYSGSYAGDLGGLMVTRGIPLAKREDRSLNYAPVGPGLFSEDKETVELHRITLSADHQCYLTKPDSFFDIPLPLNTTMPYSLDVNPANRPEMFVVGEKGQSADSILTVMGEARG